MLKKTTAFALEEQMSLFVAMVLLVFAMVTDLVPALLLQPALTSQQAALALTT